MITHRHTQIQTHTHTHTYIYKYIYIHLKGISKISLLALLGWKITVIKQIDNKIVELKNRAACHKAINSPSNHQISKISVDLQQNYIPRPIDKASGNVGIICRRFYALVLMKELGVTICNSNKTFEMINTTNENDVIDKHARFLNKYL